MGRSQPAQEQQQKHGRQQEQQRVAPRDGCAQRALPLLALRLLSELGELVRGIRGELLSFIPDATELPWVDTIIRFYGDAP